MFRKVNTSKYHSYSLYYNISFEIKTTFILNEKNTPTYMTYLFFIIILFQASAKVHDGRFIEFLDTLNSTGY